MICVVTPPVAFIYGIVDPATRKMVYVGHSKNVEARIEMHWKHRRNVRRTRTNPAFYGWLASLLFRPGYRVLAVVPYEQRYAAERDWTVRLRKTCDLFNINDGARPLHHGPLSPEHRAKISAAKLRKHRGGALSAVAA